jgi:hypothetical protein
MKCADRKMSFRVVALVMRHRPLFAPGARASYSNTNYVLLGMITSWSL